jgi:hypothetical protein
MKLLTAAAGQGMAWVRQGFATLARRPMAFVGLSSGFVFVMALSLRFPVLLMLLAAALPMISLGFMNAARQVNDPNVSTLAAFAAPLRPGHARSRALLRMTGAYVAASVVVGLLSSLAYGDSFGALIEAETTEKPDPGTIATRMADPRLGTGMIVQLSLALLLSVPFWHAPALIYWGGQGLAQALFSSCIACWRNRGAFLVYGLVFAGLIVLFMLAGGLLIALFGSGPIAAMLALSISLIIPAAFYASLYFTFTGCFELSDDDRAASLHPAPPGAPPTLPP